MQRCLFIPIFANINRLKALHTALCNTNMHSLNLITILSQACILLRLRGGLDNWFICTVNQTIGQSRFWNTSVTVILPTASNSLHCGLYSPISRRPVTCLLVIMQVCNHSYVSIMTWVSTFTTMIMIWSTLHNVSCNQNVKLKQWKERIMSSTKFALLPGIRDLMIRSVYNTPYDYPAKTCTGKEQQRYWELNICSCSLPQSAVLSV